MITGREPFLKGVIGRARNVIKLLLVLVDKLSMCQQQFDCAWQAFTSLVIDYDTVSGKISKNCCFHDGWLFSYFQTAALSTTYDDDIEAYSNRGGWRKARFCHENKLICLFHVIAKIETFCITVFFMCLHLHLEMLYVELCSMFN